MSVYVTIETDFHSIDVVVKQILLLLLLNKLTEFYVVIVVVALPLLALDSV